MKIAMSIYRDGRQRYSPVNSTRLRSAKRRLPNARNVEPLLHSLEQRPELRYLHRPANLEDVFLRLTGRDLRD